MRPIIDDYDALVAWWVTNRAVNLERFAQSASVLRLAEYEQVNGAGTVCFVSVDEWWVAPRTQREFT
jgi:hypothetical protein